MKRVSKKDQKLSTDLWIKKILVSIKNKNKTHRNMRRTKYKQKMSFITNSKYAAAT